jgi:hypothetical protein
MHGIPMITIFPEVDTTMRYQFKLSSSQMSIRVETDREVSLLNLKNSVSSMASAALDSLGFVLSQALDLEIVSCVDPTGEWHVFDTVFDGFREQGIGAAEREYATLNLLIPHALSSAAVHLALSDLRRAIREPSDTVFHCYRAVESIRQEYIGQVNDRRNRSESWNRLRQAVGMPRTDLDWLKDLSERRRHGESVDVSHEMRERALRIARDVVVKHCALRSLAPNVKVETATGP